MLPSPSTTYCRVYVFDEDPNQKPLLLLPINPSDLIDKLHAFICLHCLPHESMGVLQITRLHWYVPIAGVKIPLSPLAGLHERVANIDIFRLATGLETFQDIKERWGSKDELDILVRVGEKIVPVAPLSSCEKRKATSYIMFKALKASSPSDLCTSGHTFKTDQNEYPMFIGRPGRLTGPPVYLYHPILARLKHAIDNYDSRDMRGEGEAELLEDTHEFFVQSQKTHSTKKLRMNFLHLARLLNVNIHSDCKVEGGQTELDGGVLAVADAMVDSDGSSDAKENIPQVADTLPSGTCVTTIVQYKDGFIGGDPSIRGFASARRIMVQEHYGRVRDACCCPMLIVTIADSSIRVMAAILTEEFIGEPLSDWIDLSGSSTEEARVVRVAALFKALRRAIRDLTDFYHAVKGQPLGYKDPRPFFPQPHPLFLSDVGSVSTLERDLTYGPRIRKHILHPIWYGTLSVGTEKRTVVIKFTRRYGEAAHTLLAAIGLAPKLHHHIPLESGWRMIVMDRVDGEHPSNGTVLDEDSLHDVQLALTTLHSNGYVYGDLRRPNIMLLRRALPTSCVPVEGARGAAMLIDFDWVAQEGDKDSCYPAVLDDLGAIQWAKGVVRSGVMRRDHDLAMLEQLIAPSANAASAFALSSDTSERPIGG
ncbi:hypothetical protein OF83DRAFT_1170250 [Amylostereum chailletii]|nr:hypothetical protein OF83DRAFT_1170250 [Amylostereum chailletii]